MLSVRAADDTGDVRGIRDRRSVRARLPVDAVLHARGAVDGDAADRAAEDAVGVIREAIDAVAILRDPNHSGSRLRGADDPGMQVAHKANVIFDLAVNADIVCVRALYVDLDGAPLEPVLTSERPPHIVTATSPGKFHCYWLVEGMPLEDFRGAQEALLEKFGGDRNVKSVEHVMRVPGFLHRKGEPFLCRIHTVNQRPPYRADEFEKKPQPVYVPSADSDDEVNLKAAGEAVIFIANPNLPWVEWNRIGMAIFRATGGSEEGFEIFDRWSRRSAKYNARTTRARWGHYFRSPPERVGIATLIHLD